MNWTIKGYGVLLNPGHSGTVGAVGINPKITEELFADLQATEIRKILKLAGFPCTIRKQFGNNIHAVGTGAQGFDLALSLHFNAFNKTEHGSIVIVGNKASFGACIFAEKLSLQLNKNMFKSDKKTIHIRSDLAFLNGAAKTNCPIACLIESEMIDDEINYNDFKIKALKEAEIISNFICNYFIIKNSDL